jgi:hypothetical protein
MRAAVEGERRQASEVTCLPRILLVITAPGALYVVEVESGLRGILGGPLHRVGSASCNARTCVTATHMRMQVAPPLPQGRKGRRTRARGTSTSTSCRPMSSQVGGYTSVVAGGRGPRACLRICIRTWGRPQGPCCVRANRTIPTGAPPTCILPPTLGYPSAPPRPALPTHLSTHRPTRTHTSPAKASRPSWSQARARTPPSAQTPSCGLRPSPRCKTASGAPSDATARA